MKLSAADKELPSRPLSRGMKGEDVRELQEMLRRLGYFHEPPYPEFGGMTREAVLRFQRDHGLEADAVVGPLTRAALRRALEEKGGRDNA